MKILSRAFEVAALVALFTSGCGAGNEGADDLSGSLSTDPGKSPTPPANDATKPGAPDPNHGPGCATPPPAEVKCQEEKGPKGERCKACYDASGKVVYHECGPGEPPPPPEKCLVEEQKDGTVCQVCYDPATGKELSRACKKSGEGGGRCEEVKAGDLLCKICYDASGAPVTKECAKP